MSSASARTPASTYRLTNCELHADHSLITAKIAGREVAARIGAPGRHIVQNVLAVLGAADLAGADVDKVAPALADLSRRDADVASAMR